MCVQNASEADIEESIKNDMNRLLARNLRLIGEHPLDTVVVSRECKNLLAVHNIGQRVFAKLILSQVCYTCTHTLIMYTPIVCSRKVRSVNCCLSRSRGHS